MSNRCSQCEYLFINGVGCHETGCLNANSIQCASCNEPVQKHQIYKPNDWDGIEYCKDCAETQTRFEEENTNE